MLSLEAVFDEIILTYNGDINNISVVNSNAECHILQDLPVLMKSMEKTTSLSPWTNLKWTSKW